MRILIDHKEAALKEGTSFDYVAENRSFTGSDGYSMSITFPLRGCPQNIAIFGHIARSDVQKKQLKFDCEIHDLNFTLYGTMTIVEVTEVEAKAQFLEGRSVQNFDNTFDDIYINELDLGKWPGDGALKADPRQAWLGRDTGAKAVALPWVNNSSGNIQNEVVYENGTYKYHSDCRGLSYQPFLIDMAMLICDALDYAYDFSSWEQHPTLRVLLICNTLPWAWDIKEFARALPHWTVTEFFEKLENFLCGEFDIDHKRRTIRFAFTDDLLAESQPIQIDQVLDEYTAEITEDGESSYVEMANVGYKECSHNLWKFYSCSWIVEQWNGFKMEFDTVGELIAQCRIYNSFFTAQYGNILFYARDVDTYFVLRSIGVKPFRSDLDGTTLYQQIMIVQPIAMFGDRIVDKDSDNKVELEFVPAWIDGTEDSKGCCLFLDPGSYSDDMQTDGTQKKDYNDIMQPLIVERIEAGEESKKTEYYDCIYLAFWDGTGVGELGKLPCPVIDTVMMRDGWTPVITNMSLRLAGRTASRRYTINPKQKFTFKFLADAIPDVRSLYFIKGKRYLCEKVTATFTTDGMSHLLKGVFYPVDR